ncbi:MAG: hypothetical protein M1819_003352 [Sarea resinae]|nr:MAG: hypothetical protein M1819_003352 [Sarea resinae]
MAAGSLNESPFNPEFYLNPDHSDLLAALSSDKTPGQANSVSPIVSAKPMNGRTRSDPQHTAQGFDFQSDKMNNQNQYQSPHHQTPSSNGMSAGSVDESPFIDYGLELDLDGNFEYDVNGEQMIGSLPGSLADVDGEGEGHDKRKSPEDDEDEEDGGGKRRERDDRLTKKPGRKPLTSEPTTKRKAQNRAAQRAFRERKEKHLKDLETKVDDLEKASESANHENALLRAQVDRLQTELREYRKRLSMSGSALGRPASLSASMPLSMSRAGYGFNKDNFQFDFPKFGHLPGSHMFENGNFGTDGGDKQSRSSSANTVTAQKVPGVIDRSTARSISPKNQAPQNGAVKANPTQNGSATTAQQQFRPSLGALPQNGANGLAGLFSPSILQSVDNNRNIGTANQKEGQSNSSTDSQEQKKQSNGGGSSTSVSASPSSSSMSQRGPESSCGTSPEPSNNSPTSTKPNDNLNTISEESGCHGNADEVTFCQKLGMACGNPNNPVPRAMSQSAPSIPTFPATTPTPAATADVNGLDWMVQQNGGQFDPVLFGDYREPQDAINSNDFGDFFNEAFPLPSLGSPLNPHDGLDPVAHHEPPAGINEDDDEEVVPGEDPSHMLSCNKIWHGQSPSPSLRQPTLGLEEAANGTCTTGNDILDVGLGLTETNSSPRRDRLQTMPKFQTGELDVDNLCTELRAKARCSETGVVVDEKDVETVLGLSGMPQRN